MTAELALVDWRRRVAELYAAVRAAREPRVGHEVWRAGRDELFRNHPQSPLAPDDPMRVTGVPYWPYDPALRFTVAIRPPADPVELTVPTDNDGATEMRLAGQVDLPDPIGATVDVWWLRQYGGGLFVPLRDGSAGATSYGGGRYALDTAKSADLGGTSDALVVDLNFLYHPSCRYDSAWQCPLAPQGNRIDAVVNAGERL
ncbi:MAG TPA: DUF1684 domain-containing protein [Pseudonocardiaceae bacterium]|jgi:hypothetical protein|nr:DUF1684 domain-containing protein [Pseudonocardiaceae bacterium]